ncbi:purine/pyrimidine permease [Bacillus cereus]
MFAWGLPKWNTGMAVSSFVMVCILVSNTVAAIIAINQATIQKATIEQKQLKDGTWVGGISHIISSVFSTVGVVPLPATAGFIRLTKQKYSTFVLTSMYVISRNVAVSKYYPLLSIFTIGRRICGFNGFIRTAN